MPVDNELYSRMAAGWWDESHVLHTFKLAMNPVRVPYFQHLLADTLKMNLEGLRVLEVGCGGGLLLEEFARFGCITTGIDPSKESLEAAHAHAVQTNLNIDYVLGVGEQLPFENSVFDVVLCCDVLEHVNDVGKVVAEIARVLKPGGVFCFETVNRTWLSWFLLIKLFQEWRSTSFLPPNLHDWNMFIRPEELNAKLARSALSGMQVVGIAPGVGMFTIWRALRARKQGKITLAEMARRINLKESRDNSVAYIGHAIKPQM